ncbi:MAG: hypothetical protein WC091_25425 [Sulfuricellaceae bacterium]
MACELATIQTALCASDIGKVTDEIRLLQITAQSALDWAEAANAGVDYSLAAVQERACESGIGELSDPMALYNIIAQNLCNLVT